MLDLRPSTVADPAFHPTAVGTEFPPAAELRRYLAPDGRFLTARVFSVHGTPRSRTVLLNGLISHGGWYERVCRRLAAEGHEAHFLDRRGSGLNGAQRGDVDRWETWTEDLTAYLEGLAGGPPVLLCGISWGGKLATALAELRPDLIQGVALVCPGIYSPFDPGPLVRFLLALPAPEPLDGRRVKIPLSRPELFTDTPSWRDFIAADPLTLREATWRFVRSNLVLTLFARRSAPKLAMPVLMMLAGRDRIIDNARARGFFGRLGSRSKVLVEYPAAAHTLEFEPDPEPYFADLTDWASKTASSSFPRPNP